MFNIPPATGTLLLANLLVFLAMAVLPDAVRERLIDLFGFTPAVYGAPAGIGWQGLVDPITYQFLHGGIEHVGVNMLGLVAFGAGVERRLGRLRFLVLYLVSGVVGAFTQYALDPASTDVMIGASAAISGLFGAILRFDVFRRGFWVVVALWFVLNAVTGIAGSEGQPVAWIAHVGGFVAGLALFPLLRRREPVEA